MRPNRPMSAAVVLLIAALALLTACGVSLWTGKTIGLYGMTETRTSVFYWIIIATYGAVGVLSMLAALRILTRCRRRSAQVVLMLEERSHP
jgi:hypothetical protein